jgi:hypothetical protein
MYPYLKALPTTVNVTEAVDSQSAQSAVSMSCRLWQDLIDSTDMLLDTC